MKEKPTTFQLAQLAAQAAAPNTRAKDAVRRAMELWDEAEIWYISPPHWAGIEPEPAVAEAVAMA